MEISPKKIEEYRVAFKFYDVNNDEKLDVGEMRRVMQILGMNPTNDEITAIIQEADINEDGFIQFDEFCQLVEKRSSNVDEKERLRMAFEAFDKNKDGVICRDEFKTMMMEFGEKLTEEEVDEMMSLADTNNDGTLQWEEFYNVMSNL